VQKEQKLDEVFHKTVQENWSSLPCYRADFYPGPKQHTEKSRFPLTGLRCVCSPQLLV